MWKPWTIVLHATLQTKTYHVIDVEDIIPVCSVPVVLSDTDSMAYYHCIVLKLYSYKIWLQEIMKINIEVHSFHLSPYNI